MRKQGCSKGQRNERDLTVQRGRARCCGSREDRGVPGRTSVVEKAVGQYVACRRASSGLDPFVMTGSMQQSQKAAISARMLSSDSEGPSRKLGNNRKRNSLSVKTGDSAESVLEVAGETDDLLLRLKDNNMFKGKLEQKLSEQAISLRSMMLSVKPLVNKLSSFENQKYCYGRPVWS